MFNKNIWGYLLVDSEHSWPRLVYFCCVLRQNYLYSITLQMKKSCHGRHEDIFSVTCLTNG